MIKKSTAGEYVLRKNKDNSDCNVGDTIRSFRGRDYVLIGGTPPHHDGSTGRVECQEHPEAPRLEFYPSVFDLRWVKL